LGVSYQSPTIAVLGLAGGLLHVLNHAIFKGLLFLCAGALVHQTHTRELDQLGGLLKKMPITGVTFLIGAVAISGLPPLNGFISEFFIYLASFYGLFGIRSCVMIN
jgi:hydrogenase-4 component B